MQKPNIDPKLQLESQRLHLRQPSEVDVPHVFSATRFSGFNDGMLWEPPDHPDEILAVLPKTLQAWTEGSGFAFSIYQKSDDTFLGRISIRATPDSSVWNVGFWSHPAQQGKGVMTEALHTILQFGFQIIKAQSIEAEYATWNKASERVLSKNGFQFVEHIPKGFQKHGVWVPENKVVITKEDWLKRTGNPK
ncbi:MAG: GNAT family N-acetyltransferase [Saprospiraceae bacterium]